MMIEKFRKILSANDVGSTGGHQGGILIPKSETELLAFMPTLDAKVKNPDQWIDCIDEAGNELHFRYVYYNNKLHDEKGTRNEYRVTHMTKYFRDIGAKAGDTLEISRKRGDRHYRITVLAKNSAEVRIEEKTGIRIKLSGWRRVH